MEALDLLDGPFDSIAHTVDVRRIDSTPDEGSLQHPERRRLRLAPEQLPGHGNSGLLRRGVRTAVLHLQRPRPGRSPLRAAAAGDRPDPHRRRAERAGPDPPPRFRRPPRRLLRFRHEHADPRRGMGGLSVRRAGSRLPPHSGGSDRLDVQPPLNRIAVDPVLGRLAFPPSQLPKKGVRVSYSYGFPADIGGGEYTRPLLHHPGEPATYRVGPGQKYTRVADALGQWQIDKPASAIIEIASSGVYVEPFEHIAGQGPGPAAPRRRSRAARCCG